MKRKCLHTFLGIVLSVQKHSLWSFCKISLVYTSAISLQIVPGFIAKYLVPNCKRSVQST